MLIHLNLILGQDIIMKPKILNLAQQNNSKVGAVMGVEIDFG